ncbi:unnamed protein product [Oppiella nova]|uniref:PHD finger protein 12 n=1 Tax=Oppiella nova TaxID=334625 RepID=A0A7R9LHW8_9ACAR|nr:unnamed protein product [Oppiella nova]CAG2163130.1 unnamed protein product [Oppiella nova]
MQTIEYDLNVSGANQRIDGSADERRVEPSPQTQEIQINALTAPPTSDESSRRRKLKKSMARPSQAPLSNDTNNNSNYGTNRTILSRQTKTGKAPNHEYCDSCREGGDLLCCDRCPNAFHLQCHDPPLDEEDVPPGEWLCRKCKQLVKQEVDESEDESVGDDESEDMVDNKDIQKPFSLLIRAAQTLNPKQFQLPNEMVPSIQLVGTSKRVNHSRNGHKKQIHEMDNSMVSFPVKLCYQCSKSCRKAPLIQCDYCPLLFHADCLEPPMTVLPMGRWMCPNHSQHVIEQKLLNSVSLSERIKLWDQFSGPISQDTIKLNFLKKVHRTAPPFRTKVPLPQTQRVVVPEAIKQMYKRRPPLLPNVNQLSIYDTNCGSSETESECLKSRQHERPSVEQQEEWLSSLIAFQSSAAQYLMSTKSMDSKSNSCLAITSGAVAGKDSTNELTPKVTENSVKFNSQSSMNGPIDHSSEDTNSLTKKDTKSDIKEIVTTQMNGEKSCSSPISSPDKRISIQSNYLNANIETIADINRLDDNLVRILALQRIQQLNNKSNESNHNMVVSGTSSGQQMNTMSSFHTTIRRIGLNDVKARAVLCPIVIKSSTGGSSSGPTIAMSYRTLTIGTSSENDVVLGDYGHCNYVSPKHVAIFYDETSRNYELINYSEHGTTVDNVLYSCDFSDKRVHNTRHTNSQTVSAVKDIIETSKQRKRKSLANKRVKGLATTGREPSPEKLKPKRRKSIKSEDSEENAQKSNEFKSNKIVFRKDYDSENVERVSTHTQPPLTMSARSGHQHKPCACKSSCSSLIGPNGAGWEGTALLHHGSHLKIGCKEFIFSITNHGITQPNANTNQSAPHSAIKSPVKCESSSS